MKVEEITFNRDELTIISDALEVYNDDCVELVDKLATLYPQDPDGGTMDLDRLIFQANLQCKVEKLRDKVDDYLKELEINKNK